MRLAYAFLADAAEFTPDGKLWVLGGDLDTIRVQEFPHTYPAMALVVKLLLHSDECGYEHQIQVRVDGPLGERVAEAQINSTVSARTDYPEEETGLAFVINYQQTSFPGPGTYSFTIIADDRAQGGIWLHLAGPGV
jgi:hypothetical protein